MKKLLMFALAVIAVCLAGAVHAPSSAADSANGVYVGVWEWHEQEEGDSFWGVPHRSQFTGLFDMRTLPEQSVPGKYPGERVCCALLYATSAVDDPDFSRIGGFIDDAADPAGVGKLSLRYGTFTTTRLTPLSEVIRQLIMEHSDPTGITSFKPLVAQVDGKLVFLLGPLKFTMWEPVPAAESGGLFQGVPEAGGVVSDPFGGW